MMVDDVILMAVSFQKILMHSYSKVVLESLTDARKHGCNFHVYITESQPDESGRKMYDSLRQNDIQATLVLDSAVG